MNIDVYDMNENYVCSGTIEAPEDADFEELCNAVIENRIKTMLIEYNPDLTDIVEEVRVDWSYNGYKVYIFGVHLTEERIRNFLDTIDNVYSIGFCELFWEKITESRTYTGVVLAYDARHFHRIKQKEHSFVAFTYDCIQKFLDSFKIRYTFEDPRMAAILNSIQFRHDKLREREAIKQKMRGILVMPKVDMNRAKLLDLDINLTGKMYTSRRSESKFNSFDSYWDKKNQKP